MSTTPAVQGQSGEAFAATAPGPSIFQHPLAYLIGVEGVALMKAFAGEYDRDFTTARLAEVRKLLDAAAKLGDGVDVPPMSAVAAYDGWAAGYDDPGNGIFAIEEPYVRPILDRLPVGTAVDIACGTGRHAAYLSRLGHTVHGFDASPHMLAVARAKLPHAHFDEADLRSLPVADASVDSVVCALALAHVELLEPVFAEVARVLRPGGHLVISDTRGHFVGSGRYPLVRWDLEGRFGYLPTWRHATSDYLRAAIPHGFVVRECEEPMRPEPLVDLSAPPAPGPPEDPGSPPNIWELHAWAPEATNAVYRTDPCLIIWDFELVSP